MQHLLLVEKAKPKAEKASKPNREAVLRKRVGKREKYLAKLVANGKGGTIRTETVCGVLKPPHSVACMHAIHGAGTQILIDPSGARILSVVFVLRRTLKKSRNIIESFKTSWPTRGAESTLWTQELALHTSRCGSG